VHFTTTSSRHEDTPCSVPVYTQASSFTELYNTGADNADTLQSTLSVRATVYRCLRCCAVVPLQMQNAS